VIGGAFILLRTRGRWKHWLRTHHEADDEVAEPLESAEQPA